MPNHHISPTQVNLDVPEISFHHATAGLVTRPITDHPPMIQNTAWGAMATMNMLHPGSAIAPPAHVDGVDKLPADGREQMEQIA
ncbi:Uncharacterised protein [Legionella busanensis]|uniref:Uncharacterized protein n=1 Tax=Legionella busanensis TaxID=190655 RepID=A0A378JVV5_9GAMM|nr:hypothetical protein [Legionella busanensis]STX52342.1 Uncharacterised protein [Legionella busanensis]